MPIKTISLELDAYEKLKAAKRAGESFSAVIRRARFEPEPSTGEALLARLLARKERGQWPGKEPTEYWDEVLCEEREKPRISGSKWDRKPSE